MKKCHTPPDMQNLWCQSFEDLYDDTYDKENTKNDEKQTAKHCTC